MTRYEVSDMKAEELMQRLADTLDKSSYLKASTQVDRLHDNLVEAEVQTLGNRVSDVSLGQWAFFIYANGGAGLRRMTNDGSLRRPTH